MVYLRIGTRRYRVTRRSDMVGEGAQALLVKFPMSANPQIDVVVFGEPDDHLRLSVLLSRIVEQRVERP